MADGHGSIIGVGGGQVRRTGRHTDGGAGTTIATIAGSRGCEAGRIERSDDPGTCLVAAIGVVRFGKVRFRVAGTARDCCTPHLRWGMLDVATYVDRALLADVNGVPVRYLALDHLVAMLCADELSALPW